MTGIKGYGRWVHYASAMGLLWYHPAMPTTLHVRDLPDDLHAELTLRATARGMSLRQYTIEVLARHCALPTMAGWLEEVTALTPVVATFAAADVVHEAREADDDAVAAAHSSTRADRATSDLADDPDAPEAGAARGRR